MSRKDSSQKWCLICHTTLEFHNSCYNYSYILYKELFIYFLTLDIYFQLPFLIVDHTIKKSNCINYIQQMFLKNVFIIIYKRMLFYMTKRILLNCGDKLLRSLVFPLCESFIEDLEHILLNWPKVNWIRWSVEGFRVVEFLFIEFSLSYFYG